jgi:hypothetical protein
MGVGVAELLIMGLIAGVSVLVVGRSVSAIRWLVGILLQYLFAKIVWDLLFSVFDDTINSMSLGPFIAWYATAAMSVWEVLRAEIMAHMSGDRGTPHGEL